MLRTIRGPDLLRAGHRNTGVASGRRAMSTQETENTSATEAEAEETPAVPAGTAVEEKDGQRRAGPPKVEHFTVAERAARGKAARGEVPRRVHGEWEPSPHRPDPVDLLEEQAATRVPELVPIRYG